MRVLRAKLRRDLRRQRTQFAAVVLTIFLGVTLFAASFDAFRNLEASYNEAFTKYRFANLTITGGPSEEIARRAARTKDVEAVQTRVQADVPMQVGETKLLGRVVGLPADGQPRVNRVELLRGTYLRRQSPDGVLVEEHMADHFDLQAGSHVMVSGPQGERRVDVIGVAASPEYFWPAPSRQDVLVSPDDFGVLFAPEPLAAALAGAQKPNQVAVYYKGGAENRPLTAGLTREAEAAGASATFARAEQPSNSALQQDVKGFRELSLMFPLLFLGAAGLATSVLLRRLVTAQQPIIGMLRACGCSRGQVVRHYLAFGLLTGLAGGLPGAAVGVALAGQITTMYTSALSIPVSVTHFSPGTLAAGIAFGVVAGVLASALAAWAASRVPPAEAMRRFASTARGHRSLVERLLPARRLPARWKMVLRGIGRNRRRALSTALGVVLALTLILVSWGMIDTTQILVERQFTQINRQDAQLFYDRAMTRKRLVEVLRVRGVERVEPTLEVPVSIRSAGDRYQTSLIGLEPNTQMHEFLLEGNGTTRLPPDGILAGAALAKELDIKRGSEVRVVAPGAGVSDTAPVEGFLDESLGTFAYMSLDSLRAIGAERAGEGNSALVKYEPGVDRERLRRELSGLPGVVAFEDSNALLDTVNSYLALFYAFVGVMLVFGGAMAFALMFSAMSSNIAERSVEVATLRAAGISRRGLSRMITAENVLITVAGIGPGLLVGYWVARLFMGSFSSDQFNFDLQMRASTLILSALAILVVALLSQRPGLRAVRRLDIARVVRERSL